MFYSFVVMFNRFFPSDNLSQVILFYKCNFFSQFLKYIICFLKFLFFYYLHCLSALLTFFPFAWFFFFPMLLSEYYLIILGYVFIYISKALKSDSKLSTRVDGFNERLSSMLFKNKPVYEDFSLLEEDEIGT